MAFLRLALVGIGILIALNFILYLSNAHFPVFWDAWIHCRCMFGKKELDYFAKIESMYDQIDAHEDMGKIIELHVDELKKRNFYNFCQCEDSSNMSRLCKEIMLLYLNYKERPEKKKMNMNMRFSLAVSG